MIFPLGAVLVWYDEEVDDWQYLLVDYNGTRYGYRTSTFQEEIDEPFAFDGGGNWKQIANSEEKEFYETDE